MEDGTWQLQENPSISTDPPTKLSGEVTKPPDYPQKKNTLIIFLVAISLFAFGIAGYFAWQNFKIIKKQALFNEENSKALQDKNPQYSDQTESDLTGPSDKPTSIFPNSFEYNGFSLRYPNDWIFLDISKNEEFPLKKRLSPSSSSGKVIALKKAEVYLIVIVEKETGGGAGGIFLDDADLNKFVSNNDKLEIEGTIFYLGKNHSSIDTLEESQGGPYAWASLAEYIPRKETESGTVYRGYEYIIEKNGYGFYFIVTGSEDEATNPQIQKDIINILETVKW